MDSRHREVNAFSQVSTDELTRFQWVVPNLVPQMNLAKFSVSQNDLNVGKEFVRKQELGGPGRN